MSNPSIKVVVDTNSFKDTASLNAAFKILQTDLTTYTTANPLKVRVTIDPASITKIRQDINTAIKNEETVRLDIANGEEFKTKLQGYNTLVEEFYTKIKTNSNVGLINVAAVSSEFQTIQSALATTQASAESLIATLKQIPYSAVLSSQGTSTAVASSKVSQTAAVAAGTTSSTTPVSLSATMEPQTIIQAVNSAIKQTNANSFLKVDIGATISQESVNTALGNLKLLASTQAAVQKTSISNNKQTSAAKVTSDTVSSYTKEDNAAKIEKYKQQLLQVKNLLVSLKNENPELIDRQSLSNVEKAKTELEQLIIQYNKLRSVDKRGSLLNSGISSSSASLAASVAQFDKAKMQLVSNQSAIEKYKREILSAQQLLNQISQTPVELIGQNEISDVERAKMALEQLIIDYSKLNTVAEKTAFLNQSGGITQAASQLRTAVAALNSANKTATGSFANNSAAKFISNLGVQITSLGKKYETLKIQLKDTSFGSALAKEGVNIERIKQLYEQVLLLRTQISTISSAGLNDEQSVALLNAKINAEKAYIVELNKEFATASNIRTMYSSQVAEQDKIYKSMIQLNQFVEKYRSRLSQIPALWQRIQAIQNGTNNLDSKSLQREVSSIISAANTFGVQTENTLSRLWERVRFNARSALASWGLMLAYSGFIDLYNNVKELDTAMTELRKVTDETETTYERFLDNATSRAQKLGATLTDVVNATSDFARLGYNITDATTLSDAATIYLNVGDDVEDIDQATQSIISTMQGFGIATSDVMNIVDEFNEVN